MKEINGPEVALLEKSPKWDARQGPLGWDCAGEGAVTGLRSEAVQAELLPGAQRLPPLPPQCAPGQVKQLDPRRIFKVATARLVASLSDNGALCWQHKETWLQGEAFNVNNKQGI